MSIVDGSLSGGKSFVEEGEFVDVSEVAKNMGLKLLYCSHVIYTRNALMFQR